MAHLFGTMCNQPQRFLEALEPVRALLTVAGLVPRWGLSYAESGEVLLRRKPLVSETGVDFFAELRDVSSDYVIGLASRDDGLTGTANTQPFRFRRWMFAMDGGIDNFEALQPALSEHIPDFLQRNVKGRSSAEFFFQLFLSFLHDAGHIDDPNLTTDIVRDALRDSMALVAGLSMETGNEEFAPGNVIVSNSRCMVAASMGVPLYARRLKVPDGRKSELFKGVLALSSEQHPGEGFEEIPPRAALAISRELRTDILPFLR